MQNSVFGKKVENYTLVEDTKAGLKQVCIVETSDDEKYVYSEGTEKGWNWLSEQYIEPIGIELVRKKDPSLAPKVIDYKLEDDTMLTEYVGDQDLSDIDTTDERMRTVGGMIGRVHTVQDHTGFGGFKYESDNLTTQHDNWSETLNLLIEKRKNVFSNENIKRNIQNAFKELETDSIQPHLSHGDLRPNNFRVDSEGKLLCLIDWQNIWSSDGLSEFLYRRLANFGLQYSNAEQITNGYLSESPDNVLDHNDKQATASLVTAIARHYELRQKHDDKVRRFFDKYGTLNETISLEHILDPSKNINNYI